MLTLIIVAIGFFIAGMVGMALLAQSGRDDLIREHKLEMEQADRIIWDWRGRCELLGVELHKYKREHGRDGKFLKREAGDGV